MQLTNMDSILISGSLGRLCKAAQRQSGETGGRAGEGVKGWGGGGALQCRACSPQPLSAVPRASAGEETGHGSWSQRGLDAEEWQERSRVVHSDPAATIKIGGVRCLHSSLCKSHQPEPCLFLAAGYIIMRSAGGSKWVMSWMANMRCRSCFLILQWVTVCKYKSWGGG